MAEMLRPILELSVVIPGLLTAYFPVRSSLKQPFGKVVFRTILLLVLLCTGAGILCSIWKISTAWMLGALLLAAFAIYIHTLQISLWKSSTIALSIIAVFTCINSLARAVNAVVLIHHPAAYSDLWFSLPAALCYNALCWALALACSYPAAHQVRSMVDDDNFAQTWYSFWVLPLIFIGLNLFMIPRYSNTLYTNRVLPGYFVLSLTLLVLLLWFYAVFLMMANSLNRNARLQQENQLLLMQHERYEALQASIEEARQARHDLRHQLNQISALVESGDLKELEAYLSNAVSRIPSLEMHFCENWAADSVTGYYCAWFKQENIPYFIQMDLPQTLPVDEVDLCLVLSNLLENALEASLATAPNRRRIQISAFVRGSLVLIQIENTYDQKICEKDGIFQSSKRQAAGVGLQSIRHIAQKSGGTCSFSYQDGVFCAKVMLCR